jgi:lipopolysaccharide biosynthesis regulator YciM
MFEKTQNDVSLDCRDLYRKGCASSSQTDFDKSIALFNQALNQEPGFVECRQALRKAQLARTQLKNGFMDRAIEEVREIPELAEAEIYLHSNPLKAIRAAEQVLNHVPACVRAHKILAQAALKIGMFRTAFLSLDYVRNHGGTENIDVNLELANALAESGEVSRGLTICGRLLKEFPENRRVTRTLGRLSQLAFDEHTNSSKARRTVAKNYANISGTRNTKSSLKTRSAMAR